MFWFTSLGCRTYVCYVPTYTELILGTHFEIFCAYTYIKYCLCKYTRQEAYIIFASNSLPFLHFCANVFGAIDSNIFKNFEHFIFFIHYKIKRLIKDLLHLFEIILVQKQSQEVFLWKGTENKLQIYRKRPCWRVISIVEITLWYGCYLLNLLYIFRTNFHLSNY